MNLQQVKDFMTKEHGVRFTYEKNRDRSTATNHPTNISVSVSERKVYFQINGIVMDRDGITSKKEAFEKYAEFTDLEMIIILFHELGHIIDFSERQVSGVSLSRIGYMYNTDAQKKVEMERYAWVKGFLTLIEQGVHKAYNKEEFEQAMTNVCVGTREKLFGYTTYLRNANGDSEEAYKEGQEFLQKMLSF